MKVDLVIPLGRKCGWGHYQELKYALRSAQRYVENLHRVWVVGECPAWLDSQYHIEHTDPYDSNKDANLIQKVLRVCAEPDLSEKFIRMSDDQLFLASWKPIYWYLEELQVDSFDRLPPKWYRRLENTWEAVRFFINPVYNFDSHVPMEYSKKSFTKIVTRYDYGASPGMCINTLYANHIGGERKHLDEELRMGISKEYSISELQKMGTKAIFCNYVDTGLSKDFKRWVKTQFSEPSRFEQ